MCPPCERISMERLYQSLPFPRRAVVWCHTPMCCAVVCQQIAPCPCHAPYTLSRSLVGQTTPARPPWRDRRELYMLCASCHTLHSLSRPPCWVLYLGSARPCWECSMINGGRTVMSGTAGAFCPVDASFQVAPSLSVRTCVAQSSEPIQTSRGEAHTSRLVFIPHAHTLSRCAVSGMQLRRQHGH